MIVVVLKYRVSLFKVISSGGPKRKRVGELHNI